MAKQAAEEWDLSNATFETKYVREGGGGRRVNIEAEVPATIRETLENLLDLFGKDYTAPNGKVTKAGKPKYLDWDAGTKERAEEFQKMGKRYADYRPGGSATFRSNIFNETWVHFTFKPREQRNV